MKINYVLFLFVAMMSVNSVYAMMKRDIELYKASPAISFKSLYGFPLISLNKSYKWWELLSEKKKKDVHQQILNYEDERLLSLFNMATRSSVELNSIIAHYAFKEEKEQIEKFLNMPIGQAYCYAGFLKIINDPQNSHFKQLFSTSINFKSDIICGISEEIAVFGKWYTKSHLVIYKKDMECLSKIVDIFQDALYTQRFWPNVKCNYYDICTIDTCIQKFKENQLKYLPLFLAMYIALTFPSAFDEVLNHDDVAFNQAAKVFNAEANSLYKKTGREYYRKARVDLIGEHDIIPNYFFIIKTGSFLLALVPIITAIQLNKLIKKVEDVFNQKLQLEWLGYALSAGIVSYVLSQLSQLSQIVPGSLQGIGAMVGLYACISSCYNMARMRVTSTHKIALKDVPQVLQNKNIIIV